MCFLDITRWRTNMRCPIQCEGGKEYLACGSLCAPTCKDISYGMENKTCTEPCVEGCFCPDGFLTNSEGVCVRSEECECWLDEVMYYPGSVVQRECLQYTCMGGYFNVTKIPGCMQCNNRTEFTCVADSTCIPNVRICVSVLKVLLWMVGVGWGRVVLRSSMNTKEFICSDMI